MAGRARAVRAAPADPPADCRLCPRLAKYRKSNRKAYPDYFNGAAPSFGDPNASLLIVGLAPGLHGANRTAIPFTGDASGDLLFATLEKFGFSTGKYARDSYGRVKLNKTMITNAVRCAPPQNRPLGREIQTCRRFLTAQIGALASLRALLCLGRVAHESTLAALGVERKSAPFVHGAAHSIGASGAILFDSYHCSRYNINTRRLTPEMFESVFADIRRMIDKG